MPARSRNITSSAVLQLGDVYERQVHKVFQALLAFNLSSKQKRLTKYVESKANILPE